VGCRDIYLKIEQIPGYNPVAPAEAEHGRYGLDCVRNHGHDDAAYTVPKTDPLVPADINEPPWDHRVPGTVLYARPTERLRIHVLNDWIRLP
jgi:hypothetical protein